MIMILMEWAYMAALSFLMGFACLAPFRKKGGCQIHSAVTYMMAGLLVLNVYAEYFSLFAGVGFWASLIAVLLRSSAECCCVGIWRIFSKF